MRVIFNEELNAVADDLEHMARNVRDAIHGAGTALREQDLDAAQEVIDNDVELDELSTSIISQCVNLLARQNPVATDLRVVISTLRLAETFNRMGDLARHIAESVRRTYPESPLPPQTQPLFYAMLDQLDRTSDSLVNMLAHRDTELADKIIREDDAIDDAYAQILHMAQSEDFEGTNEQLINVVLLSRFIERLGDHSVSVSRQILYIVSGFDPTKQPTPDEGTDID